MAKVAPTAKPRAGKASALDPLIEKLNSFSADNYWDLDPQMTIGFMQEVQKPWIAFKTLAAGAIRPESGFRYAFENGADFICVGMFDFQVEQNVSLVKSILPQSQNRERDWMA